MLDIADVVTFFFGVSLILITGKFADMERRLRKIERGRGGQE